MSANKKDVGVVPDTSDEDESIVAIYMASQDDKSSDEKRARRKYALFLLSMSAAV